MKSTSVFGLLLSVFFSGNLMAGAVGLAPGGPGATGVWGRPDKEGILASAHQNVWATIAEGILTEVYYPTLDTAQTRDTELLFVIGQKTLLEERKDFRHQIMRYPQTLAYHVSSYNRAHRIRIEKDILLDPDRPAVVLNYTVTLGTKAPTKIYVLHKSMADNTAGGDAMYLHTPESQPAEILAFQSDRRGDEPDVFAARTNQLLVLSRPATEGSVGFESVNDPLTQLQNNLTLSRQYSAAIDGNVSGALGFSATDSTVRFKITLAFAKTDGNPLASLRSIAAGALRSDTDFQLERQRSEWSGYLNSLNSIGRGLEADVLVIKGLEDKLNPGAVIAAPSMPSLPDNVVASENDYESARLRRGDANGGYHRVWPRDAFQMALGLLAAGDTRTPLDVLRFFKKIQKSDGTFPQNVWVNGQISWAGFQLDETGFPIILASRLVESGIADYDEFRPMVLNAAEALMKRGPWSDQDRWEENGGLSPNSIAVACQALEEASWLERTGDLARSQTFAATCRKWEDSLLKWTFVTKGPWGHDYFERMELGNDPTHSLMFPLRNNPVGGDNFVESSIVDGGFLQWILSGLIPPLDPHITSTLKVYDVVGRGPAPVGLGYMRYNHDGYGLGHQAHSWPLLSGERALAAIQRREDPMPYIKTMLSSMSPTGMICEQTDVSACPLGWSQAEVLLVARSLADHKSFYIPMRLQQY